MQIYGVERVQIGPGEAHDLAQYLPEGEARQVLDLIGREHPFDVLVAWTAGKVHGIRLERARQRVKALGVSGKLAGMAIVTNKKRVPVIETKPSFLNTAEGWALFADCSSAAAEAEARARWEALRPYREAKERWEEELRSRTHAG